MVRGRIRIKIRIRAPGLGSGFRVGVTGGGEVLGCVVYSILPIIMQ